MLQCSICSRQRAVGIEIANQFELFCGIAIAPFADRLSICNLGFAMGARAGLIARHFFKKETH